MGRQRDSKPQLNVLEEYLTIVTNYQVARFCKKTIGQIELETLGPFEFEYIWLRTQTGIACDILHGSVIRMAFLLDEVTMQHLVEVAEDIHPIRFSPIGTHLDTWTDNDETIETIEEENTAPQEIGSEAGLEIAMSSEIWNLFTKCRDFYYLQEKVASAGGWDRAIAEGSAYQIPRCCPHCEGRPFITFASTVQPRRGNGFFTRRRFLHYLSRVRRFACKIVGRS